MDGTSLETVCVAQQIIWAAGQRLQQHAVLARLTGAAGLARARLDPRSEAIQLVAFDGDYLGHVRRETTPRNERRWVAVLKDGARCAGAHPSAAAAAEALARACGRSAETPG